MPGTERKVLDHRGLLGQGLELALGELDAVAQGLDLLAGGAEDGPQGVGQFRLGVLDQRPHPRQHLLRTHRDEDPQLAQQATQGVDLGGAGGDPAGAEAVQRAQHLLGERLDGDGADVGVAVGLQDPLGVGAVGLVAGHVGADLVRGEQHDLVTQRPDAPRPVVGRAARLHDHGGGGHLREEGKDVPRESRRVQQTLPGSPEEASSKTAFAISTATTVCFCMGSSFISIRATLALMPTESQGGAHFINEADQRPGFAWRRWQLIRVLGGLGKEGG
jgi:hypothetical protein